MILKISGVRKNTPLLRRPVEVRIVFNCIDELLFFLHER